MIVQFLKPFIKLFETNEEKLRQADNDACKQLSSELGIYLKVIKENVRISLEPWLKEKRIGLKINRSSKFDI